MNRQQHIPVLLREVLATLAPQSGDSYLDLTAGYGGHAEAMLELLGETGKAVLVDRDDRAHESLRRKFANDERVRLVKADYAAASATLLEQGEKYDCILADIGVSSPHLDNPDRGFSFMNDGPLDMRMDQQAPKTAADLVNKLSRDDIILLLRKYGEVHKAPLVTDRIIAARPLRTTKELATIIPGNHAMRMKLRAQVFQALRIVVNDELGQLEESLPLWQELLSPGGRLAVITFHSLEDRIVKQYFKEHATDGYDTSLKLLTKQPVSAGEDELVYNPRARSAKLRAVQRK